MEAITRTSTFLNVLLKLELISPETRAFALGRMVAIMMARAEFRIY